MVWVNALAGMLGLGWSNLVFNDSTGPTIFLAARKNHHGKPSGQGRNHLPPLPLPSFGPLKPLPLSLPLSLPFGPAGLGGVNGSGLPLGMFGPGKVGRRFGPEGSGFGPTGAAEDGAGSRLPKEPAAEAAGSDGAEGHVQTLFKAYTWAYTLLHHLLNWEPEFVLILQSTPPCSGPG